MTIKILGIGDTKTKALKENLQNALNQYPLKGKVVEVSEVNRIALSGVTETPALLFDNQIISEGRVPTVDELAKLLRNRVLYKSKLYRLRRIMVPVDFSDASANALRYAWEVARKFGSSIDVVHALEGIFDGGNTASSGFLETYVRSTKTDLQRFVMEAGKKWLPPAQEPVSGGPGENPVAENEVKIQMRVEYGFPDTVIEELSKKYDMIVMGTTGKGSLTAQMFGSVSIEISQHAHCPVLLIPPFALYTGFNNVMYASNFESNDPEKVKQVVSFAKHFDAQLHFVHVGKVNEPGEKLDKALFEVNYKFSDPDKPFIFQKMVGEDVSEKLNEYAFYHKIDLYVFVTPRRGFWQSLLHRSQTKKILLNTQTPVLVVHQFNDLVNN